MAIFDGETLTDVFFVSASDILQLSDGNGPAWKGFDRNDNTYYHSSTASAPNRWIKIQYPSAVTLKSYRIATFAHVAPTDFDIQGSNNDSDWTNIVSKTGENWSSVQDKTFAVDSPDKYVYFRLFVHTTSSTVNALALRAFDLVSSP